MIHPEIDARRQRRPLLLGRIELPTPTFHKLIELLRLQQLIQPLIERMPWSRRQLRGAIQMSSCFPLSASPIAMPAFEQSLWMLQHFLLTHLDLHHRLLGCTLLIVECVKQSVAQFDELCALDISSAICFQSGSRLVDCILLSGVLCLLTSQFSRSMSSKSCQYSKALARRIAVLPRPYSAPLRAKRKRHCCDESKLFE